MTSSVHRAKTGTKVDSWVRVIQILKLNAKIPTTSEATRIWMAVYLEKRGSAHPQNWRWTDQLGSHLGEQCLADAGLDLGVLDNLGLFLTTV